jgi:hypothetical protein
MGISADDHIANREFNLQWSQTAPVDVSQTAVDYPVTIGPLF